MLCCTLTNAPNVDKISYRSVKATSGKIRERREMEKRERRGEERAEK